MQAKMKAVAKTGPGVGFTLIDCPRPAPGPEEVLVRVQIAAICGSDIPVYEWTDPWSRATVKSGQIVGHEFAGVIAECGARVSGLSVNDVVTAEGHLNCNKCFHCRRGQGHLCPQQKLIGFDAPGIFAEYVCVPASNVISVREIPLVLACMLDPLGNAVHATGTVPLTNADVLVTGCGPIGLMAISIAKYCGARRVFASDVIAFRRAIASRIGADAVYDPDVTELPNAVPRDTMSKCGVDVLLEMSGNPRAIVQGLKTVRPGGNAILVGLPKEEILFDLANDVIAKGITVHGIIGRILFATWQEAVTLLDIEVNHREIGLRHLVTHILPLSEFDRGFALARAGQCGKVLLCPDHPTFSTAHAECAALGIRCTS